MAVLSTAIDEGWERLEEQVLAPTITTARPPFGEPMRRAFFHRLGAESLLGLQPTDHYMNQGGTGLVMVQGVIFSICAYMLFLR